MTTPPAPAPPTTAPRPGYRDRLRARNATAAEERIEKAGAAAVELGHTGPVPWDDLRAAYTRPSGWWGKAAAVGFVVTFACSSYRRMSDKREGLRKGYVKDGDQLVTEALDALPPLAALASAPAGRTRTEALTDVREKVSELMIAVRNSAEAAAGLRAKYAADQRRLREHGQKVRTAFADKLSELVEDREPAARELGAMALTVAARQAQAAYTIEGSGTTVCAASCNALYTRLSLSVCGRRGGGSSARRSTAVRAECSVEAQVGELSLGQSGVVLGHRMSCSGSQDRRHLPACPAYACRQTIRVRVAA